MNVAVFYRFEPLTSFHNKGTGCSHYDSPPVAMPQPSPRVVIARSAKLPDPERVALFRRAPELGPRLLFFSGGSALRELAEILVEYTHNSIHCITPFDSGGSSAMTVPRPSRPKWR